MWWVVYFIMLPIKITFFAKLLSYSITKMFEFLSIISINFSSSSILSLMPLSHSTDSITLMMWRPNRDTKKQNKKNQSKQEKKINKK